jgi:hypothetical protein
MEIVTSVVALLAPFLAKAGEGAAEEVGKMGLGKVTDLYQAVVQKFRRDKDDYGQQTLKRLEEKPLEESRQRALVDVLREKAEADQEFAQALASLVEDTTEGQPVNQFVTQIFGNVGKNVTVGTVHGDLRL